MTHVPFKGKKPVVFKTKPPRDEKADKTLTLKGSAHSFVQLGGDFRGQVTLCRQTAVIEAYAPSSREGLRIWASCHESAHRIWVMGISLIPGYACVPSWPLVYQSGEHASPILQLTLPWDVQLHTIRTVTCLGQTPERASTPGMDAAPEYAAYMQWASTALKHMQCDVTDQVTLLLSQNFDLLLQRFQGDK